MAKKTTTTTGNGAAEGIDLDQQFDMEDSNQNYGLTSVFLVLIFGLALGYGITKLTKQFNRNFTKSDNIRYTQPGNIELEMRSLVRDN